MEFYARAKKGIILGLLTSVLTVYYMYLKKDPLLGHLSLFIYYRSEKFNIIAVYPSVKLGQEVCRLIMAKSILQASVLLNILNIA